MTANNGANIRDAGIVVCDGAGGFTADSATLHNVLVGAAGNGITNVAPSATVGLALVSQGAAADPVFGVVSAAGGGTGSSGLTGVLTGNGAAAMTASAINNHSVLVAAPSNLISSVAPSVTTGLALISNGSSADPSFGVVSVAGGGTGASTLTGILVGNGTSAITATTVTQHDLIIGGASNALTSVAPSATSGIPVISQGSSADPTFGTAVVAGGGTGATTLTGLVTGNGASAMTASAITNHALLVGGASNAVTSVGPSATAGQILRSGGSSADPAFSTATYPSTAGTAGNVLTSDGTNWVSSPGGIFPWTDVTSTSQAAAANNGYVADNASLCTITLPAVAAFGSIVDIVGKGAGGWSVVYGTGASIKFGNLTTTATTGSLSSANANDCVMLICTTANTGWTVKDSVGNLTVV